ncbi:transcriptional repressor NrdR [Thermosulfuriphilus ammonigenes]|uniref:Transcriptional repressor NrdR n=1 Tax=Thermosulfuriphilus ammonigenes TaxID=1936021 RepID=A0A6G7PXF6_9BACT|nr:transcriptional regulator NrdR [Thermosulfuriphilus ammonigenes]MBA2849707.1 transcriptional repressor NrdR [Thermosulfuriphilus ammonigenes]QIJ72201.1 transcriptional repressor NrdR [Thermosulfuriphilus ammonigenes]HFB83914.1 transcriptional repressor NrdR [Thermodesulfatator sp.]
MKCPRCAHPETKVVDSRTTKDGVAIRRRRECLSCSHRFTTYERIEESLPMVVKKDGRREAFSRQKIIEGIKKACEKRPISMDEIEAFVNSLERELLERGEKEIPSAYIGERVMERLHEWDEVAYVRFASVYRQFKDVSEFIEQVQQLIKTRRVPPKNAPKA